MRRRLRPWAMGKQAMRAPRCQPFELPLNLKTAKALGLTLPQSILVRADQAIQ